MKFGENAATKNPKNVTKLDTNNEILIPIFKTKAAAPMQPP